MTKRLVSALVVAAAIAACGGGELDSRKAYDTARGGSGGSAGASIDATAGAGGSVAGGGSSGGGGAPISSWADCQGDDASFVRRAMLAVMGRRPFGQAEVAAYVDLIRAVDEKDGIAPGAPRPKSGRDLPRARRVAVESMLRRTDEQGKREYLFHWIDVYRDALRVQRTELVANPSCYSTTLRADGPAVAAYVRDNPPTSPGDGNGAFNMRDLVRSSLELDDVSPMYVGNLFAMLARTYAGANVDPVELEIARRSDFGVWFDAVYLHRDAVCLGCHNAEFSVTYDPDPAKNRHFPLSGLFEKALFQECDGSGACEGGSTGPATKGGFDGPTRMHAALRYKGFADQPMGWVAPWGWDWASCGGFVTRENLSPDPAGVDAKFGAITGDHASAWDLAESLQRGFAKLRQSGLALGPNGEVNDPDVAFAYLVAANVAENAWREIFGTPLTIATDYPRNQAARDVLQQLTDTLVSSGFSHRALLLAILAQPAFDLLAPDAGCGGGAYPMPALFDPWVIADADPARRGNGPGDGVAPLSSRTLVRATYRALGWTQLPLAFPVDRSSDDAEWQAEIGIFLKNAEPGFRGFDFQARLAWEDRMGRCANQNAGGEPDFVTGLAAEVTGPAAFTVRDLVEATKDRLLGETMIDAEEGAAIEALLGAKLDADATSLGDVEGKMRLYCGTLLSTPQLLLDGIPALGGQTPALTPAAATYGATCEAIATAGLPDGLSVSCAGGSLSL